MAQWFTVPHFFKGSPPNSQVMGTARGTPNPFNVCQSSSRVDNDADPPAATISPSSDGSMSESQGYENIDHPMPDVVISSDEAEPEIDGLGDNGDDGLEDVNEGGVAIPNSDKKAATSHKDKNFQITKLPQNPTKSSDPASTHDFDARTGKQHSARKAKNLREGNHTKSDGPVQLTNPPETNSKFEKLNEKSERYRGERERYRDERDQLRARVDVLKRLCDNGLKQRDAWWDAQFRQLENKYRELDTINKTTEVKLDNALKEQEKYEAFIKGQGDRLKHYEDQIKLLTRQNLMDAENRQGDSDDTIIHAFKGILSLVKSLVRSSQCENVTDLSLVDIMLKECIVGEGLSAEAAMRAKAQRKLFRNMLWCELVQKIFSKPFFWLNGHEVDGSDTKGPRAQVGDIYASLQKSSQQTAAAWRSDTLRRMSQCGVDPAEEYRPFCESLHVEMEEKMKSLGFHIATEKLGAIIEDSATLAISLSRNLATYEFEIDRLDPVNSEEGSTSHRLVTIPRLVKWGNSRGENHQICVTLIEELVEGI